MDCLKFLILFFSSVPILSHADFPANIHRSSSNKILLSSSCSNFENKFQEIAAWNKQATGKTCETPKNVVDSEGICTIDITTCVPDHVQKYHGLTANDVGPNCWNTALVMAQILPFMRETRSDEWAFYLRSPLCRSLGKNEKPRAGDIGSLETKTAKGNGQIHGFIHVSENFVYAKGGINLRAPFALQEYSQMNEIYPQNEMSGECATDCAPKSLIRFMTLAERKMTPTYLHSTEVCKDEQLSKRVDISKFCDKMKSMLEKNRASCEENCAPSKIQYYRCDSFQSYFDKLPAETKVRYGKVEKSIAFAECAHENQLMTGKPMKNSINAMQDVLVKYLEDGLKKEPLSESNKFLLTRLALRVRAMYDPQALQRNAKLQKIMAPYRQ